MADRGFVVEEAVATCGGKPHIPTFLGSKRSQLTGREVTQTRRIARARIHVECAIQRIKLFHILLFLPLTLFHVAEKIIKVCAYLTDFQTPNVAELVDMQ